MVTVEVAGCTTELNILVGLPRETSAPSFAKVGSDFICEKQEHLLLHTPPPFRGIRWQALLSSRIGQSLKDLVEVIEEELVHLEEVSEA